MMVELDLCLKRTSTFPLTIQEKLLVVVADLGIGTRLTTLPTEEDIVCVMVQGMEVVMDISDTLP